MNVVDNAIKEARLVSRNYGRKVYKLLKNIRFTHFLSKINELFIKFSTKNTMTPKLWILWILLENNHHFADFNPENIKERINAIKLRAKKHFFHHRFLNFDAGNPLEKNLFLHSGRIERYAQTHASNPEILENTFSFPHTSLEAAKHTCDKYATRPIPSKILKNYHESRKIFDTFYTSAGILVDNWKEKLAEFPDQNFIINSFEYFLGEHPSDKTAWKFYINFLKNANERLMFNTFSRYCRLFTSDREMRKEYIQIVEMINDSVEDGHLWWIDVIEIERIFGEFSEKLVEKARNYLCQNIEFSNYYQWFQKNKKIEEGYFALNLPKIQLQNPSQISQMPYKIQNPEMPSLLYFSPKNDVLRQQFSLPFGHMNCIISTCNFATKQKLYQSCKFFYQKSQKPLCYRLGVFENSVSTYYDQSLFLNSNTFNFAGLNGTILTNSLQVFLPENRNATSIILSKICECRILYLELKWQRLTEAEFDQLVGEKIQGFVIKKVKIKNAKNEIIKVEEIISKIPNASYIVCQPYRSMYTPETAQTIASLKRSKNINVFRLTKIPRNFDECIFEFLKDYALDGAYFVLEFDMGVDEEYKKTFYARGKEILNDKKYSSDFR